MVIVTVAALAAHSVALAGFGLDSVIEIGASTIVLWELTGIEGSGQPLQRRALRAIGVSFMLLVVYLSNQAKLVIVARYQPATSPLGIAWSAVTALVMFGLAAGNSRTARLLDNPVLLAEGRVTLVDGLLATAVVLGLALNPGLAGGGLILWAM